MSGRRPSPRPRRRPTTAAPVRGSLRVVAGRARGLRLAVPPGHSTRPTSDRVREAVFNALESLDAVDGATVLDAYAGSGALGIEALSRGAARATFAETDAAARAVVAANLDHTGFGADATVVGADGSRVAAQGPWDLVLLDPPYAFDDWTGLLSAVADGLSAAGLVVVESDREVDLVAPLRGIRVRRYGGTVVTFATRTGASS